jgi:hypothetical protein
MLCSPPLIIQNANSILNDARDIGGLARVGTWKKENMARATKQSLKGVLTAPLLSQFALNRPLSLLFFHSTSHDGYTR